MPHEPPRALHDAAHDTTLVDQAIGIRSRAEAAALERLQSADRRLDAAQAAEIRKGNVQAYITELAAQGRRALMYAGAAAIVMVAAGLAWRIADRPPEGITAAEAAQVPAPEAAQPAPGLPGATLPADRADIIVSNYVIFTRADRTIRGVKYTVHAGHRYPDERAPSYDHAWCYLEAASGGINHSLSLGDLAPGGEPVPASDPMTAAALGFDAAEVATLYEACPWLEAKPRARIPGSYAFEGDVTTESVAALIAAVQGGAREITLASPGGELGAALEAFDVLSAAGVTTRATGDCASACVILLAAGRERHVAGGARIGVHRWATDTDESGAENTPSEAEVQATSAEILARFTAAGISPELFIAASRTPAEEIRVLSAEEIIGWRLATWRFVSLQSSLTGASNHCLRRARTCKHSHACAFYEAQHRRGATTCCTQQARCAAGQSRADSAEAIALMAPFPAGYAVYAETWLPVPGAGARSTGRHRGSL
jgi:hypothetical protein